MSGHEVEEISRQILSARGFELDEGQKRGLAALDRCNDEWRHYKSRRGGRLAKMLIHPPVPRGVYLWGGVGRGKSFLMDSFFKAVPLERKVRLHFHEFMRAVHRELHDLRGLQDPLEELAIRVARRYRLICFDEFHISDVADAMILERLLHKLIDARVGFIMTSNYAPDALYPDGLQREQLLPAIDLIKQHLEVVELASATDHRHEAANAKPDAEMAALLARLPPLFQSPLGAESDVALARIFEAFRDGEVRERAHLQIESRDVVALRTGGGVAWFDFETLCAGPRSQNDYLALAASFHTIILSGVPVLSSAQFSEARRFTWLIDILYDHGRRLALSAAGPAEALYTEGSFASEFTRAVSRLSEMQTAVYLSRIQRVSVERLA
ncbi:MAG: AFG1 family ATPase [Betaproteobacteria bacterium]|nr:AFG1 family ATPase [Betaproteobacteria bacterium]NCA15838.1 AFG1 family ATPase [Betaproteobacteria bacterium]